MIKNFGIIFDCDGTLVDSLGQALESFNYALTKVGKPPHSPEAIKKFFGASADRILLNVLGDPDKAHRAFELYLDHQTELAKTTRLHTGIKELLDSLTTQGVPLGVVTGRHARDLELVLRPHNLASYFQVMVTDSELPRSKPAPDGLLKAMQLMNADPRRTFYIGDSIVDIRAAHAAGCLSIGALWDPLAKAQELEKLEPSYLAHHPSDVLTIFQRLHS